MSFKTRNNLIGDIIPTRSFSGGPVKIGKTPVIVPSVDYAASIESYENYYQVTLTNFQINGQSIPHAIEIRSTNVNKRTTKLVL